MAKEGSKLLALKRASEISRWRGCPIGFDFRLHQDKRVAAAPVGVDAKQDAIEFSPVAWILRSDGNRFQRVLCIS